MALLTGDKLGPYEIVAPIGAGGMGEVYRAIDTRLGREVALKTLPDDMASNPERLARFHREARAAAALNHPNIVTLYSVEQAGSVHFLTMELVEGQSLKDLIPPEGLPVGRMIELAASLADALAAAHDKGLAHRDLKPTNIMVTTDGRVKVLDFGLAKNLRTAGSEDETVAVSEHTRPGVVMGTPPYMSPEQIVGRAVDHRTDIFSLGIICYEMLAGMRPFQGNTKVELAAAILRDPPPPLTRADVPTGLRHAIERCLAKDPGARTVSARALAAELRAFWPSEIQTARGSAKSGALISSGDDAFWIAVAPFKFTGGAELPAVAEGLTEGIINALSKFSYLRVLTKGTTGARYVMEGSLRQAGSQLRVAVKVIDSATGANLWAETYTRAYSPDTVFEILDDLVPVIVSPVAETNGVLEHHIWVALRDRDPLTFTAYEALLRSRGFFEMQTRDEHRLALSGLTRAVEQEPNHAGCLATLSSVYSFGYLFGWDTDSALESALLYARRAVAAEPSYQQAHVALVYAYACRKDLTAVRSAGERVLALNPYNGVSIFTVGMWTAYLGDWDRGCELVEHARTLNPRHLRAYWYPLAHRAYHQRDYPRALDCALRINIPGQFWTHILLAATHGQMGNRVQATSALRELLALQPDFETNARKAMRWFAESEHVDHILEGLQKAGLNIDGSSSNS